MYVIHLNAWTGGVNQQENKNKSEKKLIRTQNRKIVVNYGKMYN